MLYRVYIRMWRETKKTANRAVTSQSKSAALSRLRFNVYYGGCATCKFKQVRRFISGVTFFLETRDFVCKEGIIQSFI